MSVSDEIFLFPSFFSFPFLRVHFYARTPLLTNERLRFCVTTASSDAPSAFVYHLDCVLVWCSSLIPISIEADRERRQDAEYGAWWPSGPQTVHHPSQRTPSAERIQQPSQAVFAETRPPPEARHEGKRTLSGSCLNYVY